MGASFFFICVYLQYYSCLYGMVHSSYPRTRLMAYWCIKYSFLWLITAFVGYGIALGVKCLFGESLVITNLVSIVPIYGDAIVILDLGGHRLV